jgi:transposase-like protein
MRTPTPIVRSHRNLWKPSRQGCGNYCDISPQKGRTIADAAGELEIGTEPFRKSVRQDEDDHGERDNRPISNDAKELKRLPEEDAEPKRTTSLSRERDAARIQDRSGTDWLGDARQLSIPTRNASLELLCNLARAGSRRTRPFHARGSAAHPGSAGWLAPRPRRPASHTPVRSLRHGSSGPPPPSPGL